MMRLGVKKGTMNDLYKVSPRMRTRLWVLCIAFALVCAAAPADAAESPEVVGAHSFVLDGTLIAKRKKRRRRRGKKRSRRKRRKKKKVVVTPVAQPAPAPKAEAKPEPVAQPTPKLATTAANDEEPDTRLAVMDLRLAKGIDASVGSLLNETIISKLDATGQFQSIISGSDMRDMIDLETQKMALGCEQDSCLAELGGALGVPYMLVSNLGRFGKQYILNIKFVAVEEAKVLGRVNKILADEAKVLEALPKALQEIVDSTLGPVEDDEPAVAQTTAAPAAATTPAVSQPAEGKSSGSVLARPLVWLGVGFMAGGAGAGYWSQQSVLNGKANYEDVGAGSDLEASNTAWDEWQTAADRHAWLQSVSNLTVVVGASLGVYSVVFGGS